MTIHKEGYTILSITTVALIALNLLIWWLWPAGMLFGWIVSAVVMFLVLQFFRNPNRTLKVSDNNMIIAPADGKIVVIEEAQENEYFKDRRIQVSIFMSPTNVHVNRNPISGTVNYFKYHPGKYLVAWHPKSSEENERTTTVIGDGKTEILFRQIAGALAKRIVSYVDVGAEVKQGADMGFIKFGSRVDLFLPLGAKVEVKMDQKVKGNRTVIARLD